MNPTFTKKRIPSLLGFAMLIGSILAISWLSTNGVLFQGKAAIDSTPQHITITDITDSSYRVVFITEDPVIGTINYGNDESALNNVILDDRDQEKSTATESTTHMITVTSLTPRTKYFFTVQAGGNTYKNGDTPYSITTGNTITERNPADALLSGTIIVSGANSSNTLVILSPQNAIPLSTYSNEQGIYTFLLSNMRDKGGNAYASFAKDTPASLFASNGIISSTALLLIGNSTSIPPITLSQSYDFTQISDTNSPVATKSALSDDPFSFVNSFDTDIPESTQPKIETPARDQEIHDQRPLFSGTATPFEEVILTITAETPITATLTADSIGGWEYRPTILLTPEKHTVTIKTNDSSEITRTLSQSFTVFADGSQFLDPSVSPVQATVTSTPTQAEPTLTNTPSPTLTTVPVGGSNSPTPTLTPTPTTSVTPTGVPIPTATISRPPPPATGSLDSIGIGIAAISAIVVGTLLFFLSRGKATL